MTIEAVLRNRDDTTTGSPAGIAGTWTNGLGSVMDLQGADEQGLLHGTYTSGVRDRHTYDLVGYANETTVAFAVNFTSSASIGTWSGHYDAETGTLEMLWHLVAEPRVGEMWDATFSGSDTFTRVP